MPTYAVTVEDAQYQVDAPDETTAWQWAYMTHKQGGAPAPKQSTVLGELKRGFKQFGSSTQTAAKALMSPEEAAKAGVERARRISEEAGEGVSFAPVKEAYEKQGILAAMGEAASQVPRAVAGMLPAAAATVAGGKAGALAGTAAAPVLGPFAPAGPVVGGLLGAGAALYGSMAGANIERQAQEQMEVGKPVSIDRPAAYGAAVGQTALEAVGTGAVLGKRLVKGVLGIADDAALATAQARQALVKEAQRSLLGATGMGALRGTAEIPVEIAQAVLERAQAGLDVMSPDAYAEYGDTAYQAMLGGAGLGALTGVHSRGQARAEQAVITDEAQREQVRQRVLEAMKAKEQAKAEVQERERVKAEGETPFGVMGPYSPEQYGELEHEKQRLLQGPQTPNVKERIAEITRTQKYMTIASIIRGQEEKAQQESEAAKAAESAFSQPEVRETPEGQGLLFSQFEAPEARVQPETLPAPGTQEAQPLTPSTLEKEGQRRLGLRGGKEGESLYKGEAPKAEAGVTGTTREAIKPPEPIAPMQPVSERKQKKVVEPTVPTPLTLKELEARGQGTLPLEAALAPEPIPEPKLVSKKAPVPAELQPTLAKLTEAGVRPETIVWAEHPKNRPFIKKLTEMAPEAAPKARKAFKLQEGSSKAEVFDALFPTPAVPEFRPSAGKGKSGMGVPSERGVISTTAATAGAGEPVGRGVVPVGGAAPATAKPEGKPAAALNARELWEENNVEGAGTRLSYDELTPERRAVWNEAVGNNEGTTELYEDLAGEQARERKREAEAKRKTEETAKREAEAKRAAKEAEAAEKKARGAEQIRAREAAKREAAAAKKAEAERIKAERESEAKRKAKPALREPTLNQQVEAFGKAIGAVQPALDLRARQNLPAQTAAKKGDFQGVISALEKSKNVVVAEVAKRAKGLGTKIVIDDDAQETYVGENSRMRQLSIDGAKMHLEALEKIRQTALQIDALPEGSYLGFEVTGDTIKALDNGEDAGEISLKDIAGNGHSMFAPLATGPINLQKKEDFKALQKAFEDITEEFGEDAIRMTSTASSVVTGVAAAYDANTDTIRVPEYFAKNEGVLAHEIVHAQVLRRIANPTSQQKPIVERLHRLYNHVKETLDKKVKRKRYFRRPYALESIQEFIAEGMSNPQFQFELKQIEYENTSAWGSFVQAIANLIGVKRNTAFTELLSIYSDLTAEQNTSLPRAELYEDLAGEQARKEKRTLKDIGRPEFETTLNDLATTPAAPMRGQPKAQQAETLSTLKKLEAQRTEGKLTDAEYHAEIQLLIDKIQQQVGVQDPLQTLADQRRGTDWIIAELRRGVAEGVVPKNEAEFAEWLLDQNPSLAADLGIDLSAKDGEGIRGEYEPLSRIITLFTSSDLGEGTAVHEILHHTERMMPKDVQQGVMDEWNQAWNRAYLNGDEQLRSALMDMLAASLGDKEAHAKVLKHFQTGALDYDKHYQLYSASEFWAVNATRILSGRHAAGSWAAQAVQWFREFVQRIKGMLGLSSDAPVLKALEAIMRGEGAFQTSAQMLADSVAKDVGVTLPVVPKFNIENPVTGKYTPSSIVDNSRVMDDQPGYIARTFKSFVEVFSAAEGVSLTDRLRTKIVFEGASLETKLNTLFDNKVRDEATGLLNPMGGIMQAKDSVKLLGAWFEHGGLTWGEKDGRWVVEDSKNGSVDKILLAINDWGKANGMEYDRASAELSKMFEAVRLDEMRTANKEEGTEFPIHKLAPNDPRSEDAQIDDRLAAFKATPKAQAIFKMMEALRHEMIDHMVAVGRLSAEMGQVWKDASGYIPFDRLQEFNDNFKAKRGSGRGIAQLKELPKFVGSTEREVGNTIDNYTKIMAWMFQQTLNQAATSKTLKTLELMGYSKYVGKNKPSNAHNVETYYKGQKVYYTVPSRWDVQAFKDLSDPKGSMVKALAGVSNILRKSITAMPWFALKQVTDDIQRAFVTSGVKNPYALIAPTLMTFFRVAGYEFVMGKQHPLSREMGRIGSVGDYDIDTLNPALSLQHKLGLKKRGKFGELLHRLDSVTRAADLAVRKSIYDQTLKETKGAGHAGGDIALATTRAREFINFRRHGSSSTVRVMTATIPFFNAYLQGMDVLYRAATGKGSGMGVGSIEAKKIFWNRILTMTAFASIYALTVSGDDDYEGMNLRTRDGSWIIPGYGRLPVPGELGVLYKLIPERVIGYLRRAGTAEDQEASEAAITALKFAYEQYGGRLTPIPAAVKPVVENLFNYSTLRGRELVGAYQQTLPASIQRAAQTSELAIAIANFTRETFKYEVSPIKIDNFLSGYFGSVAGLTTMLTDQLLNPNRPDRPLHKYALLSNYLYAPVGTQRKDEFYELREKVMSAHNALKNLEQTDINKAVKYAEDNAQNLMYVPFVTSALDQLEKTRAYRKFLRSADGAAAHPTPGEREKLIEEAERLEVELVRPLRELKVLLRAK